MIVDEVGVDICKYWMFMVENFFLWIFVGYLVDFFCEFFDCDVCDECVIVFVKFKKVEKVGKMEKLVFDLII